jgi:hypothetical protein
MISNGFIYHLPIFKAIKMKVQIIASSIVLFLFLLSSVGSVSAVTPSASGYVVSSSAGSVTYVSGSYDLIGYAGPDNARISVLVGIDVNPANPSTSGVQVGVKTRCSTSLVCEYRPFFVYGNTMYLFKALSIRFKACNPDLLDISCAVFMSISYVSSSKTMVLYFFDQTTGKSIKQVIEADQYSRSSIEWMANCPNCAYEPTYLNLYSGGAYTGFSKSDDATVSGHNVPLGDLPNLVAVGSNTGSAPFMNTKNSFFILGAG